MNIKYNFRNTNILTISTAKLEIRDFLMLLKKIVWPLSGKFPEMFDVNGFELVPLKWEIVGKWVCVVGNIQ